ncbi:MAG: hypothetical protein OXU79_21065 [Gemmatimonadota bacterium]|nr:hypothetical protein [Gemmatimonadota bacterium]
MNRIFSGLSLALLLCIGLTACGESEVERQQRVIAQKEASIDSLETEMGSAQAELVTLKTQLDSLTKFEMLLQAKNQQLQKEVKKYRAIAAQRKQKNEELQQAIAQLQNEKEADEAKIDRLLTESDSLSAALRVQRDVTVKLTQDLAAANEDIERTQKKLDEAKHAVRVVVGTEDRLKADGFLETGRRFFRKGYKLVQKPGHDDLKVTLFSIGEGPTLDRGQKLKELIGRTGKLKKDKDYTVSLSADGTHITLVSDLLKGEAVLVVVE